jgi:hypothetical protein
MVVTYLVAIIEAIAGYTMIGLHIFYASIKNKINIFC